MLAYHLFIIKLLPLPVKLHYQSLTNHAVDASKRELERAIQCNRYARCAINNGTYTKISELYRIWHCMNQASPQYNRLRGQTCLLISKNKILKKSFILCLFITRLWYACRDFPSEQNWMIKITKLVKILAHDQYFSSQCLTVTSCIYYMKLHLVRCLTQTIHSHTYLHMRIVPLH